MQHDLSSKASVSRYHLVAKKLGLFPVHYNERCLMGGKGRKVPELH